MEFIESDQKIKEESKWNICINRATGLMSKVFANGPVDRGSIPGRIIPKTQKNGI